MTKAHRTTAEIKSLCEEFRRSGKTQREFAAMQGVHATTVGSWLRRFRASGDAQRTQFIEIPNSSPIVPHGRLRIELPGGVLLHVAEGAEPNYVAALVRAIQGL